MNANSFPSNPARLATPPKPHSGLALFLDLDGTLLDIAPSPGRVSVPDDLVHDLRALSAMLDGALAIVSGRPLDEIDALLSPLKPCAGAEHGAIVRLPGGRMETIDAATPPSWADALEAAAEARPGTFVERKTHSVAVHYRRAAQHEEFYRRLCGEFANGRCEEFEVLQGKCVVEIRPRAAHKGRAVERLMPVQPFKGRRPVFVGDDATDQDGFRAAEAMGGEGHDVRVRFGGRPGEVRRWLKTAAAGGKAG